MKSVSRRVQGKKKKRGLRYPVAVDNQRCSAQRQGRNLQQRCDICQVASGYDTVFSPHSSLFTFRQCAKLVILSLSLFFFSWPHGWLVPLLAYLLQHPLLPAPADHSICPQMFAVTLALHCPVGEATQLEGVTEG